MKLFDTTFIIDAVNGDKEAAKIANELDEVQEVASISVISFHEYMTGVYLFYSDKQILDEKLTAAKRELSRFRILPLNTNIALISAKINADILKREKTVGMNDVYIAATALYYNFEMISRNIRHFKEIPDLRLRSY